MNGRVILLLLWGFLAAAVASNENKFTNGTKMVKVTKVFRKKARQMKKTDEKEEAKSESVHIPFLIAPGEGLPHDVVPVHIEIPNEYLQAAEDPHFHEPQHYVQPLGVNQHPAQEYVDSDQHPSPVYIGSNFHDKSAHGDSNHPSHKTYRNPDNFHDTGSLNSVQHPASAHLPEKYYPQNYGDLSAIPGIPDIDYPRYSKLPHTSFQCLEHTGHPGFYADVEARCQMWHYCQPDGRHDRFLCPNGTVFDQLTRVCNWWFNVHCDQSLSFYDINFDLYKVPVNKTPFKLQSAGFQPKVSRNQAHESSIHPSRFLHDVQGISTGYDGSTHRDNQDYDNERQRVDRNIQEDAFFQTKHIQSAASPPSRRYPLHMAPQPRIVIDEDNIPVAIPVEDSHSRANSEDFNFQNNRHFEGQDIDHIDQASSPVKYSKRNFAHPVAYKIAIPNEEEIPTYRERKALPGGGRKLRVVKRRRLHKRH